MSEPMGGAAPRQQWLSVGEASQFLGVDTTTLRRWADTGEVETFRTPGGHRRFSATALSQFLRRRHTATARLTDVIGTNGAWLFPAHSARRIKTQHWYRAVDPSKTRAVGQSCRRLMAALADYLAGTGSAARRHGETAARALGAQVAAMGLSAAEATEAFLFFRHAIAQAVSGRLPLSPGRKISSIRRIDGFLNRVHLVMMEAYGQAGGRNA